MALSPLRACLQREHLGKVAVLFRHNNAAPAHKQRPHPADHRRARRHPHIHNAPRASRRRLREGRADQRWVIGDEKRKGNFFLSYKWKLQSQPLLLIQRYENAHKKLEWTPAKANAEQLSARQVEGTADAYRDLPAAQATLLCILRIA